MNKSESQTLELKSQWSDECLKVISALANSKGGALIIGLNDKSQPIDLKKAGKLLEDVPNIVRNKLGIIPVVELEKAKQHEILKVTVQPSSVPISYNGKFYLRSGSTVQELQGKELADFLIKKLGVTWDDTLEETHFIEILNDEAINEFKRLAADRIPSITQEQDVVTLLSKLELIENNRLKRAAILLFAKDPQRFYSHAVVKIGRFLTETEIQTTDIVKGDLFRQVENTLEILRTKYLKSEISYEGIHRRDILEYPHEALREAIINALIHRDYRGFSQIQVRVYNDKLVIMNEGGLPPEVPLASLKTNHLSKPRNKLLAKIFYSAGFIEAWGRGTIKIVEKCIEQGLPEPDFKEEHGVMTIVFYKDKWTREYLLKIRLNARQVNAVSFVKDNGKISNKEYQKINNCARNTATNDLRVLIDMKVLIKSGKKGAGSYYLIAQ